MRTGNVRASIALVAVLAMTGCVGSDPLPSLPPTPTTAPIFASEEEALAAAEAAYAAYLEMSNLISSEGGVNPERIAPFVTDARLESDLRGFAVIAQNGLRTTGATEFSATEVQNIDIAADDIEVVFYGCWDGSGTRVIDAAGQDVTPSDRVERLILEVHVVSVGRNLPLLVDSDEPWPTSSC